MPDSAARHAAILAAALAAPLPLHAAGGGGGGYVSEAPVPWHMSTDAEGRQVIELIERAKQRIGLALADVETWQTPPPDPEAAALTETPGTPRAEDAALRLVAAEEAGARVAVPYQSLVYWSDGTTWVYAATAEGGFYRHPVVVDRIEAGTVVLREGPEPGTQVVTTGAAELFGVETGTGH